MAQTHTEGPASASILLIGEAPGADEEATGKCFKGHDGRVLDSLLYQTPIVREACLITNVARERPPGNRIDFYFEDKKCTRPTNKMQLFVEQLKKDILFFRPNIVIGLGRTALWALTGQTSISQFRGYVMESTLVPGQKCIFTYHPGAVDNEWKLHFPCVMDLRKGYANSSSPALPQDKRSLNATSSRREFLDYLLFLLHDHKAPIAVDIEVKNPGTHIDIIGFADSPNHALSFDFFNGRHPRYSTSDEMEIWLSVARVLSKCNTIMHNGLYDINVLWEKLHIFTKNFYADTLIAGHVVWPEHPRSLGFLASILLNVPAWKHTSNQFPTLYNVGDAANTYGIWNALEAEMIKQNIKSTFDFEMSQVKPASMLQLQGIPINRETQKKLLHDDSIDDNGIAKGIYPRIKQLDSEIESALGKKVNLNSSQQLQKVLYEDMNLPTQYKRRKSVNETRKTTADSEALKKLARISNNPTLDLILEWKKLTKLSQFIEVEPSPKGTVHTCYNITGATMLREDKGLLIDDEEQYRSFGRWSSSASIILPYGSGNLQNVPKVARKIYEVPGKVIVSPDYMQAEAVVVAYLIEDRKLIELFEESYGKTKKYRSENNLDVHKVTAADMFCFPIEEVTPEQRQIGKTIRHANNYSAGPGVLATKLNIPLAEAKRLMTLYHLKCPQLHLWHERIKDELRKTRTLYNLFGRKHKFTDRWGDNLFRSAYSYIPQSTVGDLMNKALVKMYENYPDLIDLLLQLHDAVYAYCDPSEVPFVMKAMKECMLMPLEVNGREFTIDVDFSIGETWGTMKEVEYTDYVKESL